MENIGVMVQKPSMNKSGKWNYLDVYYSTSDEFNEATSKMMNILYRRDSDGKCMASDEKGAKYILDLVHSTYDTINNVIRIFPVSCHQLSDNPQNINKQYNKKVKKDE